MATAPDLLPHEADGVYLTGGGLETDLMFLRGIDLPEFASFPLLDDPSGTDHRHLAAVADALPA